MWKEGSLCFSFRGMMARISIVLLSLHVGSTTAFNPRSVILLRSIHYPVTCWSAAKEISGKSNVVPPEIITTKALAQLYPALMEHRAQYGNPNIPLGTTEGRQCNAVRRMHIQGKLTDAEVAFLTDLGFIFHTLEDVYEHVDFEEMFPRLEQYMQEHGNLDIPKKWAPDPELGAWVTGIRRLGKGRIDAGHFKRLDDLGFMWVSSRKCGSKFMEQYRALQERLQDGKEEASAIWDDPEIQKFVRAQKEANSRGTLSETRVEYMTRLLGEQWWTH
jgi:Helicase associated domain